MLTSLSFASRLSQKLFSWSMSADAFSLLATLDGTPGLSKTNVHRALAGVKDFSNQQTELLEQLVAEIDALNMAVAPLKLDLRKPVEVLHWLQLLRAGELEISVQVKQ
jgi:hypothetical protein